MGAGEAGEAVGAGGVNYYPLPITHYPLPITHYPLPITHYPLITQRICRLLNADVDDCTVEVVVFAVKFNGSTHFDFNIA